MLDIYWSIDSLIIKDNLLFGYGWVFHSKYEINSIQVRLSFVNSIKNLPEYISVDAGKTREDVKCAYTNLTRALHSGFIVYGGYMLREQIRAVDLVCLLADGSLLTLAVPESKITWLTGSKEWESGQLARRQLYIYFKRTLQLVRARKIAYLFSKIKLKYGSSPKSSLQKPRDLDRFFQANERKNVCLIIDHDLGGGANHYRDRLVDSIIKEGRSVVIVTYHVGTLSSMLILKNNRIDIRLSVPDLDFILQVVKLISISEIIYNNAVSFARPDEIPPFLINIKKATSAHLRVLIHDFFCICPSHFLIDCNGIYCEIPDINICANCLPINQQSFASLFIQRDIHRWRTLWGTMLLISDEIVAFSKDSYRLLLKAYPEIDRQKIFIKPHQVSYLPSKPPKVTYSKSLRIGIVGQIGFHKGAKIVQSLAKEIVRRGIDAQIIVIGTIELICKSHIIVEAGPYHHSQLPRIIENSNANIFLFPSIWPETFSYVVHELIAMDLPVASFNLGAPAEKLKSYSKGILLDSMDASAILDNLVAFHRSIYLSN